MTRPQKDEQILELARTSINSGIYFILDHAKLRLAQREVTIPEIEYVILNGHHEKRKDEYKEEYKTWNYAIRGKTLNGRELRIALSLDKKTSLLIITVIDLVK
jgi:hypothetical protein